MKLERIAKYTRKARFRVATEKQRVLSITLYKVTSNYKVKIGNTAFKIIGTFPSWDTRRGRNNYGASEARSSEPLFRSFEIKRKKDGKYNVRSNEKVKRDIYSNL